VIDERDKNTADFYEEYVRNGLEVVDRLVEGGGAINGLRVCVEVFQQEKSEWNYS
jgi:hypothetical protein